MLGMTISPCSLMVIPNTLFS